MKRSPFHFCLVGCGKWAICHAAILRKFSKEIVFSFASRDIKKAEEYSRRFGGRRAFMGLNAAAEDPAVDAVFLCTPPFNHVEEVETAARAGKAIFIEKPIACNREEGEEIIQICRKHEAVLMVGENLHYSPPIHLVKNLLSVHAIGDVLSIQAKGASNSVWTEWRKDNKAGVGILLDEGIHYLHVFRFWGGEPLKFKRVSFRKRESKSVEDVAELEVSLERVANVSLFLSRGREETSILPWFHVIGSEGSLTLDYGSPFLYVDGKKKNKYFIGAVSWLLAKILGNDRFGRKAIIRDFLHCVRNKSTPQMSGKEGLLDLEFALNAYEHARLNEQP